MDKNIRFQALYNAYTEAYPEKPKQVCQQDVAAKWREFKNDTDWNKKSDIFLKQLRTTTLRKKGKLFNFWSSTTIQNNNKEVLEESVEVVFESASKATNISFVQEPCTEPCTSDQNKPKAKAQDELQREIDLVNLDLAGLYQRKSSGIITDDQLVQLSQKKAKVKKLQTTLRRKKYDQIRAQQSRQRKKEALTEVCEKNQ